MDFEIKDGCLVKYTGEDENVVVPGMWRASDREKLYNVAHELCFGETKVVDQSCRL